MNRYKFPRIYHCPWSEGLTNDDKLFESLEVFNNKQIVVTLKLDGENTSVYSDGYYHARSMDSRNHPSRSWVKSFASTFSHNLNPGWRVNGENVFARHSIVYTELPTYFFAFAIFNENNYCISWADTEEYCKLLGLQTVPVLYQGIYDRSATENCMGKKYYGDEQEGYVVRSQDGFHYNEYTEKCMKYVRKNHVQTDEHWMHKSVIPNQLTKESNVI